VARLCISIGAFHAVAFGHLHRRVDLLLSVLARIRNVVVSAHQRQLLERSPAIANSFTTYRRSYPPSEAQGEEVFGTSLLGSIHAKWFATSRFTFDEREVRRCNLPGVGGRSLAA
jgi:hypothetical protein